MGRRYGTSWGRGLTPRMQMVFCPHNYRRVHEDAMHRWKLVERGTDQCARGHQFEYYVSPTAGGESKSIGPREGGMWHARLLGPSLHVGRSPIDRYFGRRVLPHRFFLPSAAHARSEPLLLLHDLSSPIIELCYPLTRLR